MEFGICTSPDRAQIAARLGYSYIEPAVVGSLQPQSDDTAHLETLAQTLSAAGISAPAFNILLPGTLRVTGPERDLESLRAYLETAMARAAQIGAKILVFGSGGARNVPAGYSPQIAWTEIREFLEIAADIAAKNGICIAIEPLNRGECNILNSVSEAVQMAQEINRPEAVGALADLFHITLENQPFEETEAAARAGYLRHVHVACALDRHAPREEDRDELVSFFGALKRGGYSGGRISVEATLADFESEGAVALQVLQSAWQDARA